MFPCPPTSRTDTVTGGLSRDSFRPVGSWPDIALRLKRPRMRSSDAEQPDPFGESQLIRCCSPTWKNLARFPGAATVGRPTVRGAPRRGRPRQALIASLAERGSPSQKPCCNVPLHPQGPLSAPTTFERVQVRSIQCPSPHNLSDRHGHPHLQALNTRLARGAAVRRSEARAQHHGCLRRIPQSGEGPPLRRHCRCGALHAPRGSWCWPLPMGGSPRRTVPADMTHMTQIQGHPDLNRRFGPTSQARTFVPLGVCVAQNWVRSPTTFGSCISSPVGRLPVSKAWIRCKLIACHKPLFSRSVKLVKLA